MQSATKNQPTQGGGDDILISELLAKESNSVLKIAVIVSIVFHLLLLSIKFGGADALEQLFRGKTLEVVLINAKTDDAPSNPQVTAQVDSAGGGESDNLNDRASAPDAYAPIFAQGTAFEDIVAYSSAEEIETLRMLQSIKDTYASLPPIDPSWGANDPRRIEEEEKRRQLSNTIAVMDQKIKEINARPRRIYIAPSARRDDQALYFDAIRVKIEQKGKEAFPRIGDTPIFGKLQMEIIVTAKGDLVSTRIVESSGNPVLDNQAMAIAKEAAPFKAAPAELLLEVEKNLEIGFFMRFYFHKTGDVDVELLEWQ